MEEKGICPFCGKNITITYSYEYSIPQEETAKREFSMGRHWTGSYLVEKKSIRRFIVYSCEECYKEYQRYERWSDKYSNIALPIGALSGIVYGIYVRTNVDGATFFNSFFYCLFLCILGVILFGLPNIILYLLFGKKTTYKHASKCNAIKCHVI